MAKYKRVSIWWALFHALTYSIPFALLLLFAHASIESNPALGGVSLNLANQQSILWALAIIIVTHALIDRYAPHQRWMKWWGVGQSGDLFKSLRREFQIEDERAPAFVAVWLGIIVDNTLHLTINAATLWAFAL